MDFFNNVGGDPLKPSLFELIAQEQLRDLLQPALKYVLAVFAQRYPRYLLRVVNRHEEFYAMIMFFVEKHYLQKHGASFAENFYGLKRRRTQYIRTDRAQAAVGGIPPGESLRKREVWRSLLFLIGLPYIRAKAQDYYEEVGGGINADILDDGSTARTQLPNNLREKWERLFKKLYPWLTLLFETWLLVYNVAYLFDKTAFYRPWLSWIAVDLRRISIEDLRAAAAVATKASSPAPRRRTLAEKLRRLLLKSPQLLFDSLKVLLPTSILFIKFLEWWYSPNSPARSLTTAPKGPRIPPPHLLSPHPQGIPVDRSSYGTCPLCRNPINNATALPSGYVFCYRCAYEYVEQEGRCPVTLLPTRVWQLRKVLI